MFKDRDEAGMRLAKALKTMDTSNMVLMAIPRGGVVIGAAVAEVLGVSLSVVIPKKIGAPGNEELAIGALVDRKSIFVDKGLQRSLNISDEYIEREARKKLEEIARRRAMYGASGDLPDLAGKTIVLVDDGLATGSTAIAAARSLRAAGAEKLILAVPVAPKESVAKIEQYVDEVVCLELPPVFYAVGQFYENFEQVSDEQVVELLRKYA